MIHVILVLLCLSPLAAMGAAAVSPAEQRGSTRTRDIYVSAVDRSDLPVGGLTTVDFIVREDGVAREVLKVAPATEPMQIVLLVDDSAAADAAIRDIREALNGFLAKMSGKADIGIVTIGERPTSLVELTGNLEAQRKAVSRIFTRQDSGAYFLEGLSEVARGFIKREAKRPVVVAVITEGVEFSNLYAPSVLKELYASRAALHVITLGRPGDASTDEIRNRNVVVDEGTRGTGGRREQVLANSGLPEKLRKLADELTNQYVVTYGVPDALIPPEKVDVSSKRKDVRVRARTQLQAK